LRYEENNNLTNCYIDNNSNQVNSNKAASPDLDISKMMQVIDATALAIINLKF